MDWMDWLRLFTLFAMIAGAWRSWKRRPRKVVIDGKAYYRLEDGRVSTGWGRFVTDHELISRIEEQERLQQRR